MKIKTVFILFLLFLFLIILLQNTEVVSFRIYFWELSMSRIILLPAVLIIGFIIGFIIAKIRRKKHLTKIKERGDDE
jgi:uncharacterized integral membrane protein